MTSYRWHKGSDCINGGYGDGDGDGYGGSDGDGYGGSDGTGGG